MAVQKVRRRGRWMWRARVVLGGKSATAYRSRKDEAVEAESELQDRLKQATANPGASSWEGRVPTLAEFKEKFLTRQAAENRPSEMRLKRQVLRDHLLPAFGDLRLDQITVELVDGYKAAKLAGDPNNDVAALARNTVANHVTLIKRILHQARDWGDLDKVPRIKQVKRPQTDFDFLDFGEADRFIGSAGSWRPFMIVAIRTGLRLGELRGLQWGDVDLDNRRIRVARAYTKDGWGALKSGKGRTVDLAWDAVEVLLKLKPARVTRKALVFPSPSGQPLDEKTVYKACVRASKTAKLGRTVGPHKLRHTFGSHHAMRGTPLPQIQAWMGHADIATTMRYAHLAPSVGRQFADAVAPNRGPRLIEQDRDLRGVTTGVTTPAEDRQTAS